MTTSVPTEPEHLMRRLPRNSRHRLFARPTDASSANSARPAGREGGGGFMELGAHATPVVGGTIHMLAGGWLGLVRTPTPCGTSTDQTLIGDGHGGHWKAP